MPQPKSKTNTPQVSESNQGGTVAGSGHARLRQCDFIRSVVIGPQCAAPRALQSVMTISAISVRFDEHTMWVELTDGRTLGVPLAWFPRLLRATSAQRDQVELSRLGLHWESLDEDISISGLLAGRNGTHKSSLDTLADEALAAHRAGRSRDL